MPLAYRLIVAVLLLVAALGGPSRAQVYTLDRDHTEVRFTWDHLGLSRQGGRFTDVMGTVKFDPERPETATVEVTIPLKSISTGIKKLDEVLVSSRDYFDVPAHPEITFKSTGVTLKSDKTADVAGDLTISGITRPVVLEVVWNFTGPHPLAKINPVYSGRIASGFSASTQIRRSDWGITRGAPFVSDELRIEIETEMTREAPAEVEAWPTESGADGPTGLAGGSEGETPPEEDR